jgi:hypothetical protein
VLAACSDGGGGDGASAPQPPAADVAPVLTTQPLDTATTAGAATRLTVAASGANLRYQWQRSRNLGTSWEDLVGATQAALELAAPTLADDGTLYRVVVSSGTARVVSSAVRLTVAAAVEAPAISVQPAATSVVAGATARFAVTASGTALAYQWQASSTAGATWADITGATTPTLELPAVALVRDGERFRVRLSNSAATLLSDAVLLAVTPAPAAPAFTRQPAAASVTAPALASFSAEVVGQPLPTLQWQRSNDGGATWADIAGATGTSYSTGATAPADNGARFRVVASNATGSAASEAALLQVSAAAAAPTFTRAPASTSVRAGQIASFSVETAGTPTPALQWQVSTSAGGNEFANINGATTATFSVTPTLADDGRRYRVVASNSAGSAFSPPATLTVTPPPGPLDGRQWQAGLRFNGVGTLSRSAINDAGDVMLLWRETNPELTRVKFWASILRAGAPGEAPAVVREPHLVAEVPNLALFEVLRAEADGGWLLTWEETEPCISDPSRRCYALERRRLAPGATTWASWPRTSQARNLIEFPSYALDIAGVRGSSGDVAVIGGGQVVYRLPGDTADRALALPSAGVFALWEVAAVDAQGRFVAVAQNVSNTLSSDVVMVRGDLRAATVGAVEVVDTSTIAVADFRVLPGPDGRASLMWRRSVGGSGVLWVGRVATTGPAVVAGLTGVAPAPDRLKLRADASGYPIVWDLGDCQQRRMDGSSAVVTVSLPADVCAAVTPPLTGLPTVITADGPAGSLLAVRRNQGGWLAYDAEGVRIVSPWPLPGGTSGWMLGVPWSDGFLGAGTLLVNRQGVAVYVAQSVLSTLPTPAQPAGVSGAPAFFNWALFLK